MAKRKRNSTGQPAPPPAKAATPKSAPVAISPPARHPTLLAISILLFALWFVFLLVAAIRQ